MDRASTHRLRLGQLLCALDLGLVKLDTVTGSRAAYGSVSSPRSNARRHLKTWLAFKPCARASSATLAPGSMVNCTTWRFSDTDRHLRTRRPGPESFVCAMGRCSALDRD